MIEGGKSALTGKYPSHKCCLPSCTSNPDPGDTGEGANKFCGEFKFLRGVGRGDAWELQLVPACEAVPKQNVKALANF